MVPDLLSVDQKNMKAVNGRLNDWHTPDTHAHDFGDSYLTLYTQGPRTTLLYPSSAYPNTFQPRVWFGTNNISYSDSYDGKQIGFTCFAQINDAATVNIVIYETASDDLHDLNAALGSWYLKWTENFPYYSAGSWIYDYPSEIDLSTFLANSNLSYTLTTLDIGVPLNGVSGTGLYSENQWRVLRSDWHQLQEVTLDRHLGIFVEIIYETAGLDALEAKSYITYPSLVTRYGYTNNYIGTKMVYTALPDVLFYNDSLNSAVERPLARLIDVMTFPSNLVDEYVDRWSYVDLLSGYSDDDDTQKSTLVNPDVAPLYSLIWLSQFINVKRNTVKPTSTAWSAIPDTWQDISDLIDIDLDLLVTWTEVENYAPSFTKLVDYLKFMITNGYAGFKAGSEEAIVETVKFFLEKNKVAWIDKNPIGTNRFSVTLYTYFGDTPDATSVGGTSKIVSAAIAITKPIGIEVKHEILADI